MKKIFNLETGESWEECIIRYGWDRCSYCRIQVPKDWGNRYLNGKFECVRCEEMRADVENG
jgi:hypothetical protein